mgnify:CR=1 FL=1
MFISNGDFQTDDLWVETHAAKTEMQFYSAMIR